LILLKEVTTAEELKLLQGIRVLEDKVVEEIIATYNLYEIY
ncbi:hypothetical protein Tco_0708077, partial [Tanacetum coccineum]